MMKSITETKAQLSTLIASGDITFITNKGVPSAVIVPYQEYSEMYRFWKQYQDQQAIRDAKQFLDGQGTSYSDEELEQISAQDKK